MQILDTDTLSHLFNNHPNVLRNLNSTHELTSITIINKIELLRGRIDFLIKAQPSELLRAQELLRRTESFLTSLPTLYLNNKALAIFLDLNKNSVNRKMGRGDLLISSIALANQATLITRNIKDFRKVKNLKLENWVD